MAKTLQLRRGTTLQHTTTGGGFTGAVGEVTVDTDKNVIVVHDASTVGGHSAEPFPTITSFVYSDGASATAEKTVIPSITIACGTTNTSTTVTVAGATVGILVGQVVSGVGIPAGTTVQSIIIDTSFVLSAAATVTDATVTLTFGGVVTINGTKFDSVLAGDASNIQVTFDATSATAISVNAAGTVISCTPPAHAAGTITLKLSNASGLSATTNFIYSAEAAWSATGALGLFADGAFTNSGTVIRVQATEASDTITYRQTDSDGTVNTDGVAGLTLGTGLGSGANSAANAGYLTGTLDGTNATTYTFYATATDAENQVTTPTLFNIITYDSKATGGIITTYTGYKVHTFLFGMSESFDFVPFFPFDVDYLVIGGGGGGGTGGSYAQGGGGAGAFLTAASFGVTAQTYTIQVGEGKTSASTTGGSSVFDSITATGGGKGGGSGAPATGGSGGGGGAESSTAASGGTGGNSGGSGYVGGVTSGGGGGGAGGSGGATGYDVGGAGGAGSSNDYRTGSAVVYAGGGGGGVGYDAAWTPGTAGVAHASGGGGGDGADWGDEPAGGSNGTDGTGGGGGGGWGTSPVSTGGNGIVVIRYAA
jgi:hypothetical protein